MTTHAGNGLPGGRRSRAALDAGRGTGSASGRAGGRHGGGGARLRRRDGSGRQAGGVGAAWAPADTTGHVSPTGAAEAPASAAPPTASPVPDQTAGTARGMVARLTDPGACFGCGLCVDVCPRSAIELDRIAIVREDLCTACGECVDACPAGALRLVAP